ncbi:FecR family protein [Chitinophaga sp.]|uniref:FecR family protein n=1 Tax=Chitinophaga sp. TaxID=1869181 RepID=UPI002F92A587
MELNREDVSRLARKYLDGEATESEIRLLHEWYDTVNAGDTETVVTAEEQTAGLFGQSTWTALQQQLATDRDIAQPQTSRVHTFRWRMAAAVVLLLISAGGIYFGKTRTLPPRQQPVAAIVTDLKAPANTRAMLTLANGQQIILDSAANGFLAMQANTRIVKNSAGQITYLSSGENASLQFNTLTVPTGSKAVSLVLSDGTKVWLNVASSITYPTTFLGKERKVQIKGEAYFEVASNPAMPFRVSKAGSGTDILVLGTHFNVNAYDGEPDIKITLLEGAVKVSRQNQSATLRPGEQARVSTTIDVVKEVAIDGVVAWKEGLFVFDKTDIQSMMRQAERWYGITVQYPNGVPAEEFTGSLSRDVSLSEFLKILEYSEVTVKIKGNNVMINP